MAESRKKEPKKCGVCGDHALGSNFNAITCESCKAFFRRNALKTKEFKCPFEDRCQVDVVTRRFCQKCRLKKCFSIGMKKEWIMTEEEKKAKREKIETNRRKRGNSHQDHPSDLSSPSSAYVKVESPDSLGGNHSLLSPNSTSPLTPQTPGNSSSVNMEPSPSAQRLFAHQPLTPSECEYSPPAKVVVLDCAPCESTSSFLSASEGLRSEENSFSEGNKGSPEGSSEAENKEEEEEEEEEEEKEARLCPSSSGAGIPPRKRWDRNEEDPLPDSVYAKAVEVEFAELPLKRRLGKNRSGLRELSFEEKARLRELISANEVLKMPLACGIRDPSLLDVINMTDHAIRRLIKMSKKIATFKNLCQEDQIALLKGGCTELMILRSVMSYDPEKECWQTPQGPGTAMSIKVDVLKEARGNVYEEHKRFINSFSPEWRSDENIMLILSGIALFTPERPNTVHKSAIRLEQDTYYYLLRRYLESILEDGCEAKAVYLQLVRRIQQLHILNENHVRVYLDVNPKDVEPLLIEIFDLKN